MWDKKKITRGLAILAAVALWGFLYEDPKDKEKRLALENQKIHNAIVLSCQSQSVTYSQAAACVALAEGRY